MHNKKTTIYDIAKEAGVSTATVSRVLSKSGYPVKEQTRKKILDAVETLNYEPNIIGRMLKKNDSMDIGVIIPTISNPFYPEMVLGVEQEARLKGFNNLLCNSFRDAATERKYIETLYQKQVKGIIISSIGENYKFLEIMQEKGIKIVTIDQDIEGMKCSKVGFDYIKGGLIATEYLIEQGHNNITFVTSPLNRKSRRDAFEGYKLGLSKNGIPFNENNVIVSEKEEEYENATYEFENGRYLAKRFMQIRNGSTAIFAVNDMTAFGIIQELLGNGVKVPEEVSVVGFDNIEVSSMVSPPLTTVNQPAFETGKLACRILLHSLEGNGYEDTSIILEPSLVIRSSVAKI
ncbi:MAG TPA: LacI family DNA-binding transcriptional regulator [Clostridiales bacterium]|nr:LacI family DNA-binding transcriptional regulator [Clostridiales bacterium]